MNNITLEDLYKKAVIKQYEEVKNGEDYIYLSAPTRGKLNKLCWEIFETKPVSKDDQVVFNTLLGFPFDLNTKNKFRSNTNQFRPIETFLKGETDPDKMEVVDLAAILVDFQLRPFNKFRKQIDPDDLELINDLRDTKFFSPQNSSDDLIDEVKNENVIDQKIEEPEENQSEEPESELKQEGQKQESASTFGGKKPPIGIWRYSGIAAVLAGLGFIIYLTLLKNDCMQWSGDHYEEVSCDLKMEGIGTFNAPEPYDERIIDLRRIKVCDTTTFFKNEKAVVWYAKVGDSVEFFNTHGMHPENGRALRPITPYIIHKYVVKK
ncbi:hypothetical protein DBB36_15640 [Flavobacterium sp. WLB]|uniref:Uncharacterized protein n=1 Tax=Flavobacterium panici TaxID=2654843 RepID=A0A9N8P258_9FLAO|nr:MULTISPECIES: hypothetical protein [Flavobacterium]OWU90331.1 hypothetical protein APR43_12275 [Flavobacterium sp. NLM]PUU69048.1 hypothetical protein DBB36_15640 [Flavobacterium sp. WLB]CAC9974881.1 hypothetical protein FLAPXU55_02578 [Flavobacterium panici]